MPFAIHTYERAAGRGEAPFETLGIAGPFRTRDEARVALEAAGWRPYEPAVWGRADRRLWTAEVLEMDGLPEA